MIRKMQIKFIAIAMASVLLILFTLIVVINMTMEDGARRQVEEFLDHVMESDGIVEMPRNNGRVQPGEGQPGEGQPGRPGVNQGGLPPEQDHPGFIRSFSVVMDNNGHLLHVVHNSEELSESEMTDYGQAVLAGGENSGEIDTYAYRTKLSDENHIIVFANTSVQDVMLNNLLRISYITGGISAAVLFVIITVLSRYITRPVEMAFDKQKRFIADSSHELKTPLSVLSANLDMLQMEIGDNSRINAMTEGIRRMNGLIHELLTLVRTEQQQVIFREFNLSEVMEGVILPLEVVAFENGNRIGYTIAEDIKMVGSEEGIRKMVGALMENAVKYARKDTDIQASLYKKGHQRIIEVFNEGEGVSREQRERLFDKFYRVDDSRARSTGGYGIGLSIVKSVVDAHKGKIMVESEPGTYIIFRITLPEKGK